MRQGREPERNDLDVETASERRHLRVGPLAAEDDVDEAARRARPALEPAHDLEAPFRRERREAFEQLHVEPGVDGAGVPDRERPGAFPHRRDGLEEREVAGVREQARGAAPLLHAAAESLRCRGDDVRGAGQLFLRLRQDAGAVRRELAVGVEAVVDDAPAEALPGRHGQGRPERRLDEKHAPVDLEALPGRGERVQGLFESSAAETPRGEVFAPRAADRQERHAGRGADRLQRLALALDRAVEHAPPAARESLGELLGALAAVAPGDHGEHEDVLGVGARPSRIQRPPGDFDGRLADPEQPLRAQPAPQRPPPRQRDEPAAGGVEPAAQARFPAELHGEAVLMRRAVSLWRAGRRARTAGP